jgi:hypothetical protein
MMQIGKCVHVELLFILLSFLFFRTSDLMISINSFFEKKTSHETRLTKTSEDEWKNKLECFKCFQLCEQGQSLTSGDTMQWVLAPDSWLLALG